MIKKSRGSEALMQEHSWSNPFKVFSGTRPKFWAAASIVLALLLLAPGAFAQAGDPRLTFFGGGSFLEGDRSFNIPDARRSNYATGGKIGVRGTVDLASNWAVEGAYSYGTNNLRVINPLFPATPRAFGVRVHQITGNLLYLLAGGQSNIRPFLTVGGGLARYSPTSAAKDDASFRFIDEPATIDSNTKFDFNFGGGVEAKATDWLGVRFDLRDHITPIPRFGVPEAPAAGIADFYPVSGIINDVEVSAGIVFYFHR
jgi:opacity protein-like surface antigen